MIVPTNTNAKLPQKIAARSPALLCNPETGVRQRPSTVAFSDGTALLAVSDSEALVVDVRAGVTPAEHVQRKLMSLLEAGSLRPRR